LKRGELIILWIAGIWTAFVLVVGELHDPWLRFFSIPVNNPIVYESATYLTQAFKAAAPIWIVCALVWLTLYKRK
jgi:hypothetical protein